MEFIIGFISWAIVIAMIIVISIWVTKLDFVKDYFTIEEDESIQQEKQVKKMG